jgi:transposase
LIEKKIVFLDEYTIYSKISENGKILKYFTVNHSQKEYSNGEIHINNCENRYLMLRTLL